MKYVLTKNQHDGQGPFLVSAHDTVSAAREAGQELWDLDAIAQYGSCDPGEITEVGGEPFDGWRPAGDGRLWAENAYGDTLVIVAVPDGSE